MRVVPIAEESLGVRSMALFVDLGDIRVVLDPGVSIAPVRYGLPPHPLEIRALSEARRRLQKYVAEAEVLVISHYHRDHFTPNYQSFYMWTDVDTWVETYRGKTVIAKSTASTNWSQRRRGYSLLKDLRRVARQVVEADNYELRIGKSSIGIIGPFMHGDERLGRVVGAVLSNGDSILVYLPDQAVEDPSLDVERIPRADVYVVGGPALYLGKAPRSLAKLVQLCERGTLVLAHHSLRGGDARTLLGSCKALTYAELLGLEPRLLEYMRRELYSRLPPPNEWISTMRGGANLDETD